MFSSRVDLSGKKLGIGVMNGLIGVPINLVANKKMGVHCTLCKDVKLCSKNRGFTCLHKSNVEFTFDCLKTIAKFKESSLNPKAALVSATGFN